MRVPLGFKEFSVSLGNIWDAKMISRSYFGEQEGGGKGKVNRAGNITLEGKGGNLLHQTTLLQSSCGISQAGGCSRAGLGRGTLPFGW